MGVMTSTEMKWVGHAAHIDKLCTLSEKLKEDDHLGDKHLE